jgi:hypothetical protein
LEFINRRRDHQTTLEIMGDSGETNLDAVFATPGPRGAFTALSIVSLKMPLGRVSALIEQWSPISDVGFEAKLTGARLAERRGE